MHQNLENCICEPLNYKIMGNSTLIVSTCMGYCKSGNFRENFIFANSVKRHICDVYNSGLRHDLPISVNDRMIPSFREDFIVTKLRKCEISRFTVIHQSEKG